MKKVKTGIIIPAIIFIILVLCSPLIFMYKSPQDESVQKWNKKITVTDGKVDQDKTTTDFTVNKTGEITLFFSFLPVGVEKEDVLDVDINKIGCLTTVVVENEKGEIEYTSTAGSVFLDTTMYLEAGNYTVTYYYHSDAEAFREFSNEYLCSNRATEQIIKETGFENFEKNATTDFVYELKVYSDKADRTHTGVILLWALGIGISFGALIAGIFKYSDAPDGKYRYDERQRTEQGRGYRAAFIATAISLIIPLMLGSTGIIGSEFMLFFIILALFIGVSVLIVYWIWHECYFAINENSTRLMIFIGIFGVLNLVISVINFIGGYLIVNGVPTFRCLNLFVALLSLEIFIAILARRAANAKLEAQEGEDEE